jgi:hypothetical protein
MGIVRELIDKESHIPDSQIEYKGLVPDQADGFILLCIPEIQNRVRQITLSVVILGAEVSPDAPGRESIDFGPLPADMVPSTAMDLQEITEAFLEGAGLVDNVNSVIVDVISAQLAPRAFLSIESTRTVNGGISDQIVITLTIDGRKFVCETSLTERPGSFKFAA